MTTRIDEIEELLKLNLPVVDRLNPEYAVAIEHLAYLLSRLKDDGAERPATMRDIALRHTERGERGIPRATAPTESSERERLERWHKALAAAISTAEPTSTEEGNNSHYVYATQNHKALGTVATEIAKLLWGLAEQPGTEAE